MISTGLPGRPKWENNVNKDLRIMKNKQNASRIRLNGRKELKAKTFKQ
jgi:hypothetical protein